MSKYRSGPIPKAVKIIPIISYWIDCLTLMEPSGWTAAALDKITKYFVSSGKPIVCEEYFNKILYPRIRDDISEFGRLNHHIFNALCRATHKPAQFFKGIIFPLCLSQNTSIREAVIISSVLSRCSFPAIHAAVALAKLSSFSYSKINTVFIRILLQKRYALPNKALDMLLTYFTDGKAGGEPSPLLWHQTLLMFISKIIYNIINEKK
ncbi:hypothetical protein HZS_6921 [Henneguya salminicola]|nr:hypothetical protein HZS_6921 [Henneguya salminicola]